MRNISLKFSFGTQRTYRIQERQRKAVINLHNEAAQVVGRKGD